MRHLIQILLMCLPLATAAQQIFKSEIAPFEIRQDAESRTRSEQEYFVTLSPEALSQTLFRHIFTPPQRWSGRNITLHLENISVAYTLTVNGQPIISNSDHLSPVDVDITKFIHEGENTIDIEGQRHSIISTLTPPNTPLFKDSYLSAQPLTRIYDMEVTLSPDSSINEARLNIAIALKNEFTQSQSVDVGYDIYDPAGKLLDFSVNSFEVEAGACDTIRFNPIIYGTSPNRWSPDSPKLYRVMLYTRRNDIITEYIPLKVGFLDVIFEDSTLSNFDTQIDIKSVKYSVSGSKEESSKELKALKAEGINTIQTLYPQPTWLYELCQELGLWVIDQPNINSTREPLNKKIGGTPANDPTLTEEYIRRAKGAYSRTRNFGNVIAYSLAGETSGNGYNMYKVYEWMKSAETRRPIIYEGARGEWNSDIIE